MSRLVAFGLALACAAAVAWVHVLPLDLEGVEEPASKVARFQVQSRLARENGSQPLSKLDLEARTDDWIRRNPSEFATQRAALAAHFRDALRYSGDNGKQYTYLGDQDSYTWVRLARNYLQHGTTCDEIVDGVCRDTQVNAPLGTRQIYGRSLHIVAIAALQRLITIFEPQQPLTATAFWIPVILAALGVFPTFWMATRIAGPVAGIGAALLVALHPFVMQRSIGSDNDIWNIVLPMYADAAAVAALLAGQRRSQIAWAVVAAVFTALHAATWNGWIFNYAVLLAALTGTAVLCAVGSLLQRRLVPRAAPAPTRSERRRGGRDMPAAEDRPPAEPAPGLLAAITTPAIVLAAFLVVSGIGATIARPEESYLALPGKLVWSVLGSQAPGIVRPPVTPDPWPNMLNTVSELRRSNFSSTVTWSFGRPYFIGAMLGLLLLLVPTPWTRARVAVLIGGALPLLVLGTLSEVGPFAAVALAGVPFAAAALLRASSPRRAERDMLGPMMIAVMSFVAGLFASFSGARLIMLFAPGLALAIGLAVGRLHELGSAQLARSWPRAASWTTPALGALLCLLYVPPLQSGYATGRNYIPAISDAWWDTFTKLRQQSAPDAIVNVWWDYGYWAKYIAERRVTADGSTLLTHLPYWLGRALVAPSDRESMGLLRMLSCGSDATPLPEGERGAFSRIERKLNDRIRAHQMLIDVVVRTRQEAAAYLAEHGFSDDEQEAILAVTHCRPPETYLVIGTDLTAKDSWMRLAAWDFQRAYIAQQAATQTEAAVVADVTQRFGYSPAEATSLYADAKRLPLADFVIGPAPRAPSVWYPCRPGSTPGEVHCPLGLFDVNTNKVLDEFVYNTFAPQRSIVRYRHAEPGHAPSPPVEQPPAALLIAANQLREVTLPTPRYADTAILLDERQWRILVGPAPLIRSTFTQLLFLDGRYAPYFEKFDERTSYDGNRLQTWRLRFPED